MGDRSFFDVLDEPGHTVFQTFLGFSGTGGDGPFPFSHLLHSQFLQDLYQKGGTSSGCKAWTRSCLLAKMRTGTFANYFSWVWS